MLIAILILTTLIFGALVYLISQCGQALDLMHSKKESSPYQEKRALPEVSQEKDTFDDMSEAILQAFIDYKRTQEKR
jgi:hypothetical protein